MASVSEQARSFVGRNQELLLLLDDLDHAAAGSGRARLLVGEPGIGKTRLCDEVASAAHARGMRVCFGRAWQAGGAPAYFPWLDTLRALCDELDAGSLSAALGPGAHAFAELVPSVREKLTDLAKDLDTTAEQARFRLHRSVSELLRAATRERGALIVIDDLHAADEASLKLLYFLARQARGLRALVLATCRDVDVRLEGEVARSVRELERECEVLVLSRLPQDDAESLLKARAGEVPSELCSQVAARAQGNPLFVEEMARALRSGRGSITALPTGVRELIRERLAIVGKEVRAVLELTAVFGDEVERELLIDAAGALPETIGHALSLAVQSGVLTSDDARRYRFSHALVRDALVLDLEEQALRALHARWVATLSRKRPGQSAELAFHCLRAGAVAEGLAHAEDAAARALSVFAEEDAQQILERTLLSISTHASDDARLLARAQIALARVHILRGKPEQGRQLCAAAVETARALGDPELLSRAALARGLELTAALIDEPLVQLLDEARTALPEVDSALRVQVIARLAAAMQPHRDLMYPIGLARQAIEQARRLGDPGTLLDALYTGMAAMMDIVEPKERMPLNLEVEKLAHDASDFEKLLRTQARLAFDHMELGELAAADARIAQLERLARAGNARRYLWRVPLFHSMRAMMHGRFADSERALVEARALGADDPQMERTCALHHEGLLRAAERHADMIAFDPEARRHRAHLYSGAHWQNGGSAFTCARVEDTGAAARYLALVPTDDWPLVHNPSAFLHLGEPLALCGDRHAVEHVYELIEPARDQCVSWGYTKVLWEGTASRVLALLAERLGRTSDADGFFAHAIDWLERLDAQPFLARTRYEHGRALLARGKEPEARAAIGAGREIAASLGMSGLVRLCEARLPAPKVVQRASKPPHASPLELTFVHEGDVYAIHYESSCVRLKESLGLHYLARLVASPSTPITALELASGQDGQSGPPREADSSDAGEHLDEQARTQYRSRLAALREQLEEAEARTDAEAAERAREEIDFLAAELSRAVGLSGRVRRAGAASERARSAVQRRIKSALERLHQADPALAQVLEITIKTGTSCEYRPELYKRRS